MDTVPCTSVQISNHIQPEPKLRLDKFFANAKKVWIFALYALSYKSADYLANMLDPVPPAWFVGAAAFLACSIPLMKRKDPVESAVSCALYLAWYMLAYKIGTCVAEANDTWFAPAQALFTVTGTWAVCEEMFNR